MEKIKEKVPKVDDEILEKILTKEEYQEERQVIVHCHYYSELGMKIRIWPTTYLMDHKSNHKSQLITAFDIPLFPVWKSIPSGKSRFTLVFGALPITCLSFDLFEDCGSQAGGFYKQNIQRTKSDVYSIWLG